MSRAYARRSLPWALASVFTILYATLAIARYRGFMWTSWDLGIFTEVVSHYGHLQAPIAEVKGAGFDFLGDHFSPILAILGPLYRIFPSPVTLLVAHSVLLGLSVVPVAGLALRRLGAVPAAIIAVSYGLSFGLVQAVQVDFHEIAFAVPMIAFAAAALVEERWRAAIAWSVPLVLVKEDLGATVAVVGLLVAAPWRRPWEPQDHLRRVAGLALAVFGLLASAIEVLVLIPHFAAGNGYEYFSKFGGGGVGGWGTRARTFGRLLLVCAAVAVRSPISLLALPTLAWRFASDNPAYWGTDWHYDAVLMPIAFIALVDGVERLGRARTRLLRWWGAAAIPIAAAVAFGSLPWSPLRQLTRPVLWQDSGHRAALRHAIDLVPPGVTVASDLGALSHLAGRDRAYWIGTSGVTPRYVVVDENTGWGPPAPPKLASYFSSVYGGVAYRLLWTGQGVSVLERTAG
ncbi:MAG TPA: DUF2079 domain-containing protein [Marmoricola sp.]